MTEEAQPRVEVEGGFGIFSFILLAVTTCNTCETRDRVDELVEAQQPRACEPAPEAGTTAAEEAKKP